MKQTRALYSVDDENGCWLWSGSVSSTGYGTHTVASPGKRTVLAHRWVFSQEVGPIPDGYDLDHLCRTPRCVNPAHLEPVPPAVNCQRGARAKLTEDQVADIRRQYAAGEATQPELATMYGVHNATVSRIVRGQRWPINPTGRTPVRSR